MEKVLFDDIIEFKKKSTIKAGNGLALHKGNYPFYTSSNTLSKSIDEFLFEGESLIFGTGGQASIHFCSEKFAVSTDCFVTQIKNPEEWSTKFIYHFLSGNIHLLENGFKGAGLKHISKEYLKSISIPKPSLSIQKTIAAKLDKAQEIIVYNQQLLEKYDQLTQALFTDMFGDPVKNEKGWEKVNLGTILNFLTSGSRGWAKYYSDKGDVFLRIQNVGYNKLKLNEIGYVDAPSSAESERTRVKEGDIVLSITADLGRTAIIPKDFPTAYINQHLAILRIKDEYNPNFVSAYIASKGGQLLFNKLDKGGVKAGLNFQDIKSYELFNVPLNLQNQFAERIEKIEIQKQMAQESLTKSEELFQSLLKESFR